MAVLLNDPAVIAIPIIDNMDEMVDLRLHKDIRLGPSPEIEDNQCYTYVRREVYSRLCGAQNKLPPGIKFELYEGWRSLELQKHLFETRLALVRKENPTLNQVEAFTEACRMVSPVTLLDGTQNVPPHSTGGAVDIYLVTDEGSFMDMGLKVADWMDDIDGSISQTDSQSISPQAKKNRQIMGNALSSEGFINYPNEYWHWSYGDRYWAYHTGKSKSFYGPQ
jgi:D-alanyl-D-alanine dipeptidase